MKLHNNTKKCFIIILSCIMLLNVNGQDKNFNITSIDNLSNYYYGKSDNIWLRQIKDSINKLDNLVFCISHFKDDNYRNNFGSFFIFFKDGIIKEINIDSNKVLYIDSNYISNQIALKAILENINISNNDVKNISFFVENELKFPSIKKTLYYSLQFDDHILKKQMEIIMVSPNKNICTYGIKKLKNDLMLEAYYKLLEYCFNIFGPSCKQ